MSKRQIILLENGKRLVLVDSITQLEPEDQDQIVISGSHGGISVVGFTLRFPPRVIFFNDAGIGKDEAGIQALRLLDQHQIAAATYSHMSACIGDAHDAWLHGTVSHTNRHAEEYGVLIGETIHAFLDRCEKN